MLVGTPGTNGAGILYDQDTCPIMNQHHDRALALGVWIAKHISKPDAAAAILIENVCIDWPAHGFEGY